MAKYVSGHTETWSCFWKRDLFSEVYFIPVEVSNTVIATTEIEVKELGWY